MSTLEDFSGLDSARYGYGCLCVLFVAADGRACVIPVSRKCDCRRVWVSLADNESKISITVCNETSNGRDCQEQASFDFCRNAIVDCVDEKCVLISDPYSKSCILFFDTAKHCSEFRQDLQILRPEPPLTNEFEIERRLLREDKDWRLGEAFADAVRTLRNLPGRTEVIIELDAGLGLVSDAIVCNSRAQLVAITRPSIEQSLRNYLRSRNHETIVVSDVDGGALSSVRASALVSRRLNHFLFDSDILKRFLKVRNTTLREGGRILPSELVIKAALTHAPNLWRLKEHAPAIWHDTCAGVSFRSLYDRALEEEFSVPVIDGISECDIVSNVQETSYELNSAELTEDNIKKFNLRFEFQTTTCTDVDGIVFWCVAVIDGREVRLDENLYPHPEIYRVPSKSLQICSEANVACMLQKTLREVPADCTVVVDCEFTENRTRSYDISLEYKLSKSLNQNSKSKYSMMLAKPHPYGKTIRRQPELEKIIRYADVLIGVPNDPEDWEWRPRPPRQWRRTHVERIRFSTPTRGHPS